MESDGFFHYRERISLLQLSDGERIWLLDPLAVSDLSALGAILADPKTVKILHGSDYDLRSFDREYRFTFAGLYDTAIATQLLHPELMGLGRAVETYLGVSLPKQTRLQRSNWSQRPLPREALEYAALDVAYLHALRAKLEARLEALGRTAWLREECALLERIRYEPPPPPEQAVFGTKGTFDLSPQALAIFKELYLLRERSAERMDRPPFKVISNEALLALAREPHRPLDTLPHANRRWLELHGREIRKAIERGQRAEPLIHPSKLKRRPSPWGDTARERWRVLSAARAAKAAELGIAPSTLWPTRSLEQICLDPDLFDAEVSGTSRFGVRTWQREVFGPDLSRLWPSLRG